MMKRIDLLAEAIKGVRSKESFAQLVQAFDDLDQGQFQLVEQLLGQEQHGAGCACDGVSILLQIARLESHAPECGHDSNFELMVAFGRIVEMPLDVTQTVAFFS